ncbi:unnamed protein product [Cochlearia groenlandica]
MELEYDDEIITVKLKYEKLHGFCHICHVMTHDDKECPLRVVRPEQERGFNRRPDWEDRRDGKDRRQRNQGEERNQGQLFRNRGESSFNQNHGRGENPPRQPLQRQLLPEFTATVEAPGKEGVVIDIVALANFTGESSGTQQNTLVQGGTITARANRVVDSITTVTEVAATVRIPEKSDSASFAARGGDENEKREKNGPGGMGLFRPVGPGGMGFLRPDGLKGIIQGPKSGMVDPFSAPLSKSWYDETVEEEEKEKQAYLLSGDGPYSAPNVTTGFLSTGRDTQGNRLGIEEIISPFKGSFRSPNCN